jgi:DNA polymerase-1
MCRLDDAGRALPGAAGAVEVVPDAELAAAVARVEHTERPRWVWEDTSAAYGGLLRGGVRVARSHDLALTEALLLGHDGRWGEPCSLAAAHARQTGAPVPEQPPPGPPANPDEEQTLFGLEPAARPDVLGPDRLQALIDVHAGQLERVGSAAATSPGFSLMAAAESAAGLAAAEMGHAGLPWRADVHDALLAEALGPRPALGGRPARLQALAEQVAAALAAPGLNPDSPADVMRAFGHAGVPLRSTRRSELRRVDHPAVEPLLRYKELARLHSAHGWAWREQWVRDGRFHPEYVPSGVVSGRWASRGGGALQIPRAVRAAVVADPGWALVIADAGQLEPRLLAALSADPGMVAATAEGDLYAAIAAQALGRPQARAEAKLALLSAMYGGGAGSPALAALRRRFPAALDLLEDAARLGESGGLVRSVLGRTCPPPPAAWLEGQDEELPARARARGRFTRNFVIQASAADWANVLVAGLRTRLAELPGGPGRAELVFFQHDEVIVHTPAPLADGVRAAVTEAAEAATRMVVGDRGVRIPLQTVVATSYAEKA